MATTPNWGLQFPSDYSQPADSPNALEDLAVSTDTALTSVNRHSAKLMPPTSTAVYDGQLTALAYTVPGTLDPGQEVEIGPIFIQPGTLAVCGTQHPSTYLHAVYNDRGDGTAVIRVRNGTVATPHSNVKVHIILINPPAA